MIRKHVRQKGGYKRKCKYCGSTRFKRSGLYRLYYCKGCNRRYKD